MYLKPLASCLFLQEVKVKRMFGVGGKKLQLSEEVSD